MQKLQIAKIYLGMNRFTSSELLIKNKTSKTTSLIISIIEKMMEF